MTTYTVQGSSSVYRVVEDEGRMTCYAATGALCPAWRNSTAPKTCKHCKAARAGHYLTRDGAPTADRAIFEAMKRPTVAPAAAPPAPMLASAMTTRRTGVAFDALYARDTGWLMEEKIDGHRCTVVVKAGAVVAYSRPRAGAAGANVRELPARIVAQLQKFPDGTYDGELVAPSGKAWDVTVIGAQLVFVAFDLLALRGQSTIAMPYGARRGELLDVLATMPRDQTAISTVESVFPSWAAIEAIWARGGEGVILKRIASTYQPGHRSPDWIKVKAVHAATCTITGFEAGKSGPYSKLALRDADGHETTVKTLGTALLADIARAPASFVGRRVVISYQEKTPGGSYRHGIFDHFAGPGE
jgi:bifunctional non-homologous end joining protein LigD